jgi:hypothetical protein
MSDTYSEDEFVLIESPCQEVVESRPSEIESVVKEFVSRVIDTAIEKHLCLQEHLNCGSIETKNINKPTKAKPVYYPDTDDSETPILTPEEDALMMSYLGITEKKSEPLIEETRRFYNSDSDTETDSAESEEIDCASVKKKNNINSCEDKQTTVSIVDALGDDETGKTYFDNIVQDDDEDEQKATYNDNIVQNEESRQKNINSEYTHNIVLNIERAKELGIVVSMKPLKPLSRKDIAHLGRRLFLECYDLDVN